MNVLIACEYSGIAREAFRAKGHNAWSCDLLPAEDNSPHHVQMNVLELIYPYDDLDILDGQYWDLMIAHPPCDYLCSAGLHWNKRRPERVAQTEEALRFVKLLLDAPIEKIALENPVGCISTRIRPASQYIQPYEYGHDASKKTGLWLKNLPCLVPNPQDYIEPRIVERNGKKYKRWANQTDSGQNKLTPSEDRWKERARTYTGIASKMAEQWG